MVKKRLRPRKKSKHASWKVRLIFSFLAALPLLMFATEVFAQSKKNSLAGIDLQGSGTNPLVLTLTLGGMALVPFLLMVTTSFVKIAVVLSIVRSALGTQQNPPTQVITGLAVILTIYVMVPLGMEVRDAVNPLFKQLQKKSKGKGKKQDFFSGNTISVLLKAAVTAQEPIRKFLKKHSHMKDRTMFYSLAYQLRAPKHRKGISPDDFTILIPSFVISELKEAFQIGFLIFLPFIVIDMVVANILLALGMHMLSPTTISLPFKLLLFVMIDGWYLITKGLIVGYL